MLLMASLNVILDLGVFAFVAAQLRLPLPTTPSPRDGPSPFDRCLVMNSNELLCDLRFVSN